MTPKEFRLYPARHPVFMMLISSVFAGLGQLAFKLAAVPGRTLGAMVLDPRAALAIVCYALSLVFTLKAYKHGRLGQLYPVIAMSSVWLLLVAVLWLGEVPTLGRLVGTGLIVAGVWLVGTDRGT